MPSGALLRQRKLRAEEMRARRIRIARAGRLAAERPLDPELTASVVFQMSEDEEPFIAIGKVQTMGIAGDRIDVAASEADSGHRIHPPAKQVEQCVGLARCEPAVRPHREQLVDRMPQRSHVCGDTAAEVFIGHWPLVRSAAYRSMRSAARGTPPASRKLAWI